MRVVIGICLVVLALVVCGSPNAQESASVDNQPLKALPEIVGQQYCSDYADVVSVGIKLRVRYENRSTETLILDKWIGRAWYRDGVARDLSDLADGKYEYHPIPSWVFTDGDKLPLKPNPNSPGRDFAILKPGQAFESDVNSGVIAVYENPNNLPNLVGPGVHVLQVELSAWDHPGEASSFAKSWQKFGRLIAGMIKTEPVEITIPSNLNLAKLCK